MQVEILSVGWSGCRWIRLSASALPTIKHLNNWIEAHYEHETSALVFASLLDVADVSLQVICCAFNGCLQLASGLPHVLQG